jgi:hypothetical protein
VIALFAGVDQLLVSHDALEYDVEYARTDSSARELCECMFVRMHVCANACLCECMFVRMHVSRRKAEQPFLPHKPHHGDGPTTHSPVLPSGGRTISHRRTIRALRGGIRICARRLVSSRRTNFPIRDSRRPSHGGASASFDACVPDHCHRCRRCGRRRGRILEAITRAQVVSCDMGSEPFYEGMVHIQYSHLWTAIDGGGKKRGACGGPRCTKEDLETGGAPARGVGFLSARLRIVK